MTHMFNDCWKADTFIGRCFNTLLAICVLHVTVTDLTRTAVSQSAATTQRDQLDLNPDPYVVNFVRLGLLILSCNNKLEARFAIITLFFS
jgi:hypothetical protein